jgi:hypothetical protein
MGAHERFRPHPTETILVLSLTTRFERCRRKRVPGANNRLLWFRAQSFCQSVQFIEGVRTLDARVEAGAQMEMCVAGPARAQRLSS